MLRGVIQYIVIKYSSTRMLVLIMFKIHTTNTTCIKSILFCMLRHECYLTNFPNILFVYSSLCRIIFVKSFQNTKQCMLCISEPMNLEKFNSKTTESGEKFELVKFWKNIYSEKFYTLRKVAVRSSIVNPYICCILVDHHLQLN